MNKKVLINPEREREKEKEKERERENSRFGYVCHA